MILLDEIDVNPGSKEKEKRDSLPPYSPRRSLKLPVIAVPGVNNGMRSFTSTLQSSLHPRSASVPSTTLGPSQSTLTLNSNGSTQTLVPPLPTLSPSAQSFSSSTSQLSIPFASSLTALPPHRTYPPLHLRAANNVYVERDSAAVTGSFLIDPALHVPDCLLPDDPDVLLVRGTMNGVSNGKGKQRRSNLCIVTRGGDVCVDIWVREGCARRRRRETNGSSSHSSSSQSSQSNSDSQNDSDYWQADWTSPPSSYPWPEKTEARTNIDIRSESGSITVRIHAQSHQRLRINLSSAHGSISVGVPRYFAGYVQANAHIARGSSGDSVSSLPRFGSTVYLSDVENDMKTGTGAMGPPNVLCDVSQGLPITPRQPVQFSGEMEESVIPLSEQRKSAKGRYLVGGSKLITESTGSRYLDELNFESRTGAMGVSFNDEPPPQKSDKLITKLLNKAW